MTLQQMILLMLLDKQPPANSKDAKLFELIRRIFLDKTLTELKFSRDDVEEIGTEGMSQIAEALKSNNTVKVFNIDGCEKTHKYGAEGYKFASTIDTGVIEAIAKTLTTNTTIEQLSLYNCHVTDEGAQALANALRQNKTLKILNLGQNGDLTVSGIELFVTILESGANTTLTSLHLSEHGSLNNPIGKMIARTFSCLHRNKNGAIQKQLMVNSNTLTSSPSASVAGQEVVTAVNSKSTAIRFSSTSTS